MKVANSHVSPFHWFGIIIAGPVPLQSKWYYLVQPSVYDRGVEGWFSRDKLFPLRETATPILFRDAAFSPGGDDGQFDPSDNGDTPPDSHGGAGGSPGNGSCFDFDSFDPDCEFPDFDQDLLDFASHYAAQALMQILQGKYLMDTASVVSKNHQHEEAKEENKSLHAKFQVGIACVWNGCVANRVANVPVRHADLCAGMMTASAGQQCRHRDRRGRD